MARTETLQLVQDRWAALCGLDKDNIIADDAAAFLLFAAIAIDEAWQRAEWTFVTKITAHITDSLDFIDLSSNTEISEVLRAYDKNPNTSTSATELEQIPVEDDVNDGVYVKDASTVVEVSVSGLVSTGTTATATTAVAHNLNVGDSTIIAGANESDYNGTFVVVTVADTTTFTYTMLADPVDTATGTITSTKATVYLYSRIRETVFTSLSDTIPFKLGKYVSLRASADFLRSEGQENKANARLSIAENALLNEIDRLERQQQHQPLQRIGSRIVGIK
jgi:hypothetical protein